MSAPHQPERIRAPWPDRALTVCGVLLLLAMPLPAGSNRDWALAGFAVAWAGLAALVAFRVLALPRPRRLDRTQIGAVVVWCLWLLWIALQAAPLPVPLLEALAPASLSAYREASAWVGMSALPRISVDVDQTHAHLRESAMYFCLFLWVLLCVRDRRNRIWLVYGLILAAVLQALWGTTMTLSGAEIGPFGRKTDYLGSATGSFINRNHFAGYLQIGGALAVGLLLARVATAERVRGWREALRALINLVLGHAPLLRIALLLIVVGLVASRSRMGNIAFFTAITLGGVLFILRNRGNPLRSLLFLALVLALDLVIVGGYLGLDELMQRMQPTQLMADQRLASFPDLVRMAEHYLPLGAGLGSFAVAYPQFRSPAVFANNTHAHNDPLQFLIETGIPGVVLLGLLLTLALGRALQVMRRRRDPQTLGMALGAALAVLSLGLHGLTDFNLQIPANAASIVALLGLMLGLSARPRRRREDSAEQPLA
ncbi:O-antigen ligase family protein [Sinimarinibacterium thermocellulolyticum]|uniref:O-antigen ligase family protein n=1 Tax=Sinimarinibacterium thermocellulolyticum TaxID=3170016 RepID=A0ABV2ABR6_9GAMM